MRKSNAGGRAEAPQKPAVPLRLEVSGTILDDLASIFSASADFIRLCLSSLGEVLVELKRAVIRFLRRHRS